MVLSAIIGAIGIEVCKVAVRRSLSSGVKLDIVETPVVVKERSLLQGIAVPIFHREKQPKNTQKKKNTQNIRLGPRQLPMAARSLMSPNPIGAVL